MNFWSLHSTIPEVLSSFVNKNGSCDNGGKNNDLITKARDNMLFFSLKRKVWVIIIK